MDNRQELSNLMQIRAFCQVVDQGSVSRAADELYRTQSAITRAIRDLETRLAVPLFERHANGMMLTDFGKCILPRARRAIEELHQVAVTLHKLQSKNGNSRSMTEPLYLFNVNRLQIFVSLCQTRHMQTVAKLLGLSQPAVSAALRVMENGAEMPLLQRTPQGMIPGIAGQEILPYIRRALNELRHIPADIAELQGVLVGRVQIGALPLSRSRLLPQAILAVTERYPGIRIITNESAFAQLATGLRSGEVDFIIGALRTRDYAADMVTETLFSEEMVILARPGHPLNREGVTPDDLRTARWVLPRSETPARELLDRSFEAMQIPAPNPVVESGDLAIVRGLLLGSDMLAAVSARQLEHELSHGELVTIPLSMENTRRAIGITSRAGSLLSPAAKAMIDAIRQQLIR
ncbi:LysR substrate-binding domain-containing protein [Tatumella citrea]|uniref:LysR family transcriptional regulator n=1 Tax=Tatumella citrea TaxID=53336 RepID=A0A1Y0L8B9_TATCI|nr:LysR substrate-binding domain-containing protein [Tatumella citrea]ARU94291.1 LysR family transcriptional regulator [Tatumella citrea]ARU98331.1 LysR family transcriptional regulator [Tatumella citrea]